MDSPLQLTASRDISHSLSPWLIETSESDAEARGLASLFVNVCEKMGGVSNTTANMWRGIRANSWGYDFTWDISAVVWSQTTTLLQLQLQLLQRLNVDFRG